MPAMLLRKMLRPMVIITTAKMGSPNMGLRTTLSAKTPSKAAIKTVIEEAAKKEK
jgi:hypothetical protein